MVTEKLGLDDKNGDTTSKPARDDDTHYFESYEANGMLNQVSIISSR